MATHNKKVSIATRISEYPGVFREDDEIMFCNYCDHSVEWRQSKKQTTLSTIKISSESKREVIENLIKAFSFANILLEKVNSLLPFFKKYLKEGSAIPQATTLYQLYLLTVFECHLTSLQDFFIQKP
ncbi:9773_t:CDS:2, partial [Racocetra persica]